MSRRHRGRVTIQHQPTGGARTKARLEQLETMKNAGLITKEEYREKRQEIIDSL